MAKQKVNQTQQANGVQSYTNTGDGGGTGYYVNIGGIKYCWGTSGSMTVAGAGNKTISLPAGFFTTIQSAVHDKFGSAVFATQFGNAPSTSTLNVYFGTGTGNCQLMWYVIGT